MIYERDVIYKKSVLGKIKWAHHMKASFTWATRRKYVDRRAVFRRLTKDVHALGFIVLGTEKQKKSWTHDTIIYCSP